ncbi:M56 family metallopeptidase [Prevotella sp. E13-27]|uniref:M56 family metallopeptidase n=1 Tax=Prevotella sp. E13-27 TaxID=2938122 RepID=UPI00200AB4FF|nr:M56 family metallopeptidase [Prevotella sp. E13-27]MCK8623756.1 M56 family metallopeptidase [Prevotella sp. E13-27]
MMQFLIYDLRVAILIAVFYMFYRLLLSHETFHRVNRMVLLFTSLASFVLPLCIITMHRTVVLETIAEPNMEYGSIATMAVENSEPQTPLWQTLVIAVFFAGMMATLGKTLFSIISVWKLIMRSERHVQPDGTTICIVDGSVSPFSWMRYIVISRKDHSPHIEDNGETFILAHERGHIRQHHSLDLLLVDTLTALQWFNPAMWMLRQDLRTIHEYEADAAVLSQGINMRQYQYLLIQKAVSRCGYSVANGISHSTLKSRINMMLHKNSSRTSLLKLLALLPIVGTTLALQAETVNDYVYNEPQTPPQKVVKKGKTNAQVKVGQKTIEVKAEQKTEQSKKPTVDVKAPNGVVSKNVSEPDKVFDVVEQMPLFPGGQVELMKYLSANVKYPVEASKNGIQGRVIVQFVVEKDGTISNVKVVNNADEQLKEEAIRVVKTMPKWVPGKQNGKEVRVKYTLPVTFRLN